MAQIKIHPKIWTHVRKMYDQYYGSNYKDVLISLLGANETDIDKKIFNKLSLEDGLIVIRDLLENNEVKNDINNNWNNYGDFICGWRPQLIDYLQDNGIIYDENAKKFSLLSGEAISLLVPNRKLEKLVYM